MFCWNCLDLNWELFSVFSGLCQRLWGSMFWRWSQWVLQMEETRRCSQLSESILFVFWCVGGGCFHPDPTEMWKSLAHFANLLHFVLVNFLLFLHVFCNGMFVVTYSELKYTTNVLFPDCVIQWWCQRLEYASSHFSSAICDRWCPFSYPYMLFRKPKPLNCSLYFSQQNLLNHLTSF